MPFSVGDVVCVSVRDVVRNGQLVRIERVLPKRHSVQDFQEYIVEFPQEVSERFRFCLYREFELRQECRKDSWPCGPPPRMKTSDVSGLKQSLFTAWATNSVPQ